VFDATDGIEITVSAIPEDGTTITRSQYNSPIGMSCGSITSDGAVYEADCSWTPDSSQMGQVFNFCFVAEDS